MSLRQAVNTDFPSLSPRQKSLSPPVSPLPGRARRERPEATFPLAFVTFSAGDRMNEIILFKETDRPMRRPTGFVVALLLAAALSALPHAAWAVTRGEVVEAVVQALKLPPWTGSARFADVPPGHPHAKAIETAAALGVLLPTDHFHPDMEAARAEALFLALRGMGWRHEAEVFGTFFPVPDADIPPYLLGSVGLAGAMNLPAPREFLDDPRADVSVDDLVRLTAWLRQTTTQLVLWEGQVSFEGLTLVVHRQGLGSAPTNWAVQVGEYAGADEASAVQAQLRKLGLTSFLAKGDEGQAVLIGPYAHYAEAWTKMTALPSTFSAAVVPQGGTGSRALFWAALVVEPGGAMPRIAAAPTLGAPRLPLSRTAALTGATAAVNGGFFSGNAVIGSLVADDVPYSLPQGNRGALAWSESGEVAFGNGNLQIYVDLAGSIRPVAAVNGRPPQQGVALYTAGAGGFARDLLFGAVEASVVDGRIQSVRHWNASNHAVPEGGFLVAGRGVAAEELLLLEPGDEVKILRRLADPAMDKPWLLQAGPRLIADGRPLTTNEGFNAALREPRHPRTFVGQDGLRLWWVVVDGRDAWHSSGLTLDETRNVAAAMGLKDVLNLDGGGSSALWWRGSIVNRPSDGKERPLPYAVTFGPFSATP